MTFLKDWSEVSAPVQVLAALAQVPQVPVLPAVRPLAPVLAARLLALVPGGAGSGAGAGGGVGLAALVLEPGPELQPSVALVLARGPRPCAHT